MRQPAHAVSLPLLCLLAISTAGAQESPILQSISFSAVQGEIRVDITGSGPLQAAPEASRPPRSPLKLVVDFPGTRNGLRRVYRFEEESAMRLLNTMGGDEAGGGMALSSPTRLVFQLRRPFEYEVQRTPSGCRIVFRVEPGTPPGTGATRGVEPVISADTAPRRERAARPAASSPPARGAPAAGPVRTAPADSGSEDEYLVGPGDILRVVVHGDDSLSRENLTVMQDGLIDLPYMRAFRAGGKPARQIEKELETYLGTEFLREPDITVSVMEYHSQVVTVLGQVKKSQRLALRGPTRLMDAISECEGFEEAVGDTIRITRSRKNQVISVRVADLQSGSQVEFGKANVLLEAGDIIDVLKHGWFYVSGEVQRPGQFKLDRNMDVLGAISVAGGLTVYARKEEIVLIRKDPAGGTRQILVNLKKVMAQKEENLLLEPDDQIHVPTKFAGK